MAALLIEREFSVIIYLISLQDKMKLKNFLIHLTYQRTIKVNGKISWDDSEFYEIEKQYRGTIQLKLNASECHKLQ